MSFFTENRARLREALAETKKLPSMVGGSMMIALHVIIDRFATIQVSQLLEIGFSFLALAASGFLYGPLVGALVGGVADILGFLIRSNGAFFIGFTLNEFLGGLLYGLWLYKRPVKLWRTFAAVACVSILVSFILNPIWLHIMYGNALALSTLRMVKTAIKLPVDTALLFALLKGLEKYKAVKR